MAIQLNDRDHLIFKLIDEHQVLLEKHISWFLSADDKPVLIRDRLRKLFYLDYLLCQRHATKLPWWTTPTKPLVYLLSPMARTMSGYNTVEVDLLDSDIQRHYLEVANLRMLYMMAQKDLELTEFAWTTCKAGDKKVIDAKVFFINGGKTHKIGLVNHPVCEQSLIDDLKVDLEKGNIDKVLIISRDDLHQQKLQKLVAGSDLSAKCAFAVHHELYRSGMISSNWQTADAIQDAFFVKPVSSGGDTSWGSGYNPATTSAIA